MLSEISGMYETPILPQSPSGPPEYPGSPATEYPNPPPQPTGWQTTAMRIAAGGMALLFMLACPASLFLLTMERVALNPATYKDALNSMGFYDQLPALMAGTLSDSIAKDPTSNEELAGLSRSDLQEIIGALVSRDWAQQQTESVIDQLFTWLGQNGTDLHVRVSMTDVKQRLAGAAGQKIVLTIIDSWPPCTGAQIAAVTAEAAQGNLDRLPDCRPPDEMLSAMTPYLADAAAQGANLIPDSMDLAEPNGQVSHIDPASDPRPSLHVFQWLAWLSPLLPLLLIVGVAALAVRSWKALALWVGLPLVIAAVLGGLIAVAMLPLRDLFTRSLLGGGSAIPATLQDVATRLFGAVFETAGWWIAGEALLVGGAGAIILLAGYLLVRSRSQAEPVPYAGWR